MANHEIVMKTLELRPEALDKLTSQIHTSSGSVDSGWWTCSAYLTCTFWVVLFLTCRWSVGRSMGFDMVCGAHAVQCRLWKRQGGSVCLML